MFTTLVMIITDLRYKNKFWRVAHVCYLFVLGWKENRCILFLPLPSKNFDTTNEIKAIMKYQTNDVSPCVFSIIQ